MPINGIRLLAHRGSRLTAPENTIAAVAHSRNEGADGIEIDVKLSSDGEPFIFHDVNAERMTGTDVDVAEAPWKRLKELKVRGGHPIPHLDDMLKAMEDWPGAELTIDFHQDSLKLAEVVAERLGKSPVCGRSTVLAFYSHRALVIRAREVDPRVRLSLMPGPPWNTAASVRLKAVELCMGWDSPRTRPLYGFASRIFDVPKLIKSAQERGTVVSGGVANTPEDVRFVLSQGCDGVWTDDIVMTRKVLESRLPTPRQSGQVLARSFTVGRASWPDAPS